MTHAPGQEIGSQPHLTEREGSVIGGSVGCQVTYRAFGCGIAPADWRTHFEVPGDEQETLRDRLLRITMRVQATLSMRYELRGHVALSDPTAASWFEQHDLPSLELAYLFGCLDTLAGSSEMNFPDWLRQQKDGGALALALPITTIDDFVKQCLATYAPYKAETGVGACLRRLYKTLEADVPSLINWLGDNIRVVRTSIDGTQHELRPVRAAKFLLFEHVYERRRNKYAHESVTHYIHVEDDIRIGEGFSSRRGLFMFQHDRKLWSLYIRNGLDEATLLRMIVYVAVLRSLDLDVTPAHIEAYIGALSLQSALYGFLRELGDNITALTRLHEFAEHPTRDEDMIFYRYGISPLSNRRSTILATRFRAEDPSEQMLKAFVEEYAVAVSELNALIAAFNNRHPPSPHTNPPDWEVMDARRPLIAELTRDLKGQPTYRLVMEPGAPTTATRIEHVRAADRIARLAENPWHSA